MLRHAGASFVVAPFAHQFKGVGLPGRVVKISRHSGESRNPEGAARKAIAKAPSSSGFLPLKNGIGVGAGMTTRDLVPIKINKLSHQRCSHFPAGLSPPVLVSGSLAERAPPALNWLLDGTRRPVCHLRLLRGDASGKQGSALSHLPGEGESLLQSVVFLLVALSCEQ